MTMADEHEQKQVTTTRADVLLEKKWPAELDILQSAFPYHFQSTVLRVLANAEGCLEKAGEMLLQTPKDLDDAYVATKTKSGREVKTPLMSGDELFAQNGGGHAMKPKREEKFWCQVLREETTKVLPEEEKEGKEKSKEEETSDDDGENNREPKPTGAAMMIALGGGIGTRDAVAWESDRWPTVSSNEEEDDAKKFSEKNVEKVLGWREKSATKETTTERTETKEIELLVKFKNVAYFHSRWVPESFVEKQRLTQLYIKFPKVDPVTGEANTKSVSVDVAKEVMELDKIVAVKPGALYLCKWKGLNYDELTEESFEFVEEHFPSCVPDFNKEEMRWTEKNEKAGELEDAAKKPEDGEVRAKVWTTNDALIEPEKFNGKHTDFILREYQAEGVKWITSNFHAGRPGCILADEMGLGKTAQAINVLEVVCERVRPDLPTLVVAPLSTLVNWERECQTWIPHLNVVVYSGTAKARAEIRDKCLWPKDEQSNTLSPGSRADVVLTTYEMVNFDKNALGKIEWSAVVVDEAHKLKNSEGKLFNELSLFKKQKTLLLTGTPLQNNVGELWSLLKFVDPQRFAEREKFEKVFGNISTANHVDALHAVLKPYLLRRLKTDVEQKLPPRVETLVECELAPLQKKCYRALFERNFSFLSSASGSDDATISMKEEENGENALSMFRNVMMEVRKCCQHPFLLDGVENAVSNGTMTVTIDKLVSASGKLQLLDKLLPKLKANGSKVLIFSQMTRVLDVLEDYNRARGHKYERLDGGVTGKKRQESIDRFSAEDSEAFLFLLSTRAGGQGINLTKADTVIVFDSDWNPQNDAQALARAHRIGQTKAVQVYRLVSRGTYEKEMFTRASMKLGLEQAIFGDINHNDSDKENAALQQQQQQQQQQKPSAKSAKEQRQEVENLLKHGAYGLLTEAREEAEKRYQKWGSDDIDSILQNSEQKVVDAEEDEKEKRPSDKKKEKSSLFATATFASEASEKMNVDLDDPDFWQKLMPEQAEEEKRLEAQKKRLEEQKQQALLLSAKKKEDRRMANGEIWEWSWQEKRSSLDKLAMFGFGNWEKIYDTAQLKNDKTIAHLKAFCRRYASLVVQRHEAITPVLRETVFGEIDEDEKAIVHLATGGEDYLNEIFADRHFYTHCKERSSEDALKLEMLLCGWKAVQEVGGIEGASMELDVPDVSMGPTDQQKIAPPAKWWNEAHDRALICGTFKWGFGKYNDIRDDEELAFAWDFKGKVAPEEEKKKKAVPVAKLPVATLPGGGIIVDVPEFGGGVQDMDIDKAADDDLMASMRMMEKKEDEATALPAIATDLQEQPQQQQQEDDMETEKQWVHGRHLAYRIRRLFAALGNKPLNAFSIKRDSAALPKPPKAPKEPKPKKEKKPKAPKVPKEPKPKKEKKPKAPSLGRRAGGGAGGDPLAKLERAAQAVKELPRKEADETGYEAFQTPIGPVGGVTIECLGTVLHSPEDAKKGWSNVNYILPLGFKTTKLYSKLDPENLEEKCTWTQEIKMDESEKTPLFSLTTEDGSIVIEKKSATACWGEVLQRAKTIREQKGEAAKKTAISGPEFFGYSLHTVRLMIEQLPNAEKCDEYVALEKTLRDAVARQQKEKEAAASEAVENAPTTKEEGEEKEEAANDENADASISGTISPARITTPISPSRAFDSLKTTPLKQQSPSLSNAKKRPSPTQISKGGSGKGSSSQKKTKKTAKASPLAAGDENEGEENDDVTQSDRKRNDGKERGGGVGTKLLSAIKKKMFKA